MKQLSYFLYLLIICSLFVQVPVYESETSGNTLNLFHVLIAITFVLTSRYQLRLRLAPEFLFILSMVTTSIVAWLIYGMNARAVLLPILVCSFVCGYRWASDFDAKSRASTYSVLFFTVFTAIAIRNLYYFYNLPIIYSRSIEKGDFFYLASGGRNIEATLLGMLSVLLVGSRWFVPSLFISLLSSVLMLSRAGLVAVLISIIWWALNSGVGVKKFYIASLVTGICALLIVGTSEKKDELRIVDRFNIQDEQSLAASRQGRLAMWNEAVGRIKENPLGFGVGNGFLQMNKYVGMHFRENNVHNIFLELTLDGGVQSLVLLLTSGIVILSTRNRQVIPEVRIAIAYLILGLVEFIGYDAIGWFFIGASCAIRLTESEVNDTNALAT